MAIYRCAGCGAVNRVEPGRLPGGCLRCRRALDASGAPQDVDSAALVSALSASPAPVLVDFVGRGEPAHEVAGLARDRAGELVVLRVDAAREPAATAAYGIGGTPTLVLFHRGAEIGRGALSAEVPGWLERARALAPWR